jgi:hypothetical protein
MSQENVETVRRAITAINDRDLDRYVACCTAEVQLQTRFGGLDQVYEGVDDVRQFVAELVDTGPDFRIVIERLEALGSDRVLAFTRITLHGRASGLAAADQTPTANVYDLVDSKLNRITLYRDRHTALEVLGLPE